MSDLKRSAKMTPSSQFSLISIFQWCAASLMFGTIGWLAFKYRKHINPSTVQSAMRGEKKELDPEVAQNWAKEVKRFRRIGLAIWLLFIALSIIVLHFNSVPKK